jgi:hypothetical protein
LTRAGRVATAGFIFALLFPLAAQVSDTPEDRFAGLKWSFVRIKYHFDAEVTAAQQDYYGEPWFIDGPAAEQNLSRRLKTATSIQVEDPRVMTLDDPDLFTLPLIYMVEPGISCCSTARFASSASSCFAAYSPSTIFTARTVEHLVAELKRVFPIARSSTSEGAPIFSSFYKLTVPADSSSAPFYRAGRGKRAASFRTEDDPRRQRPADAYINWNTDMGDGWEWSNAEDYPDYVACTAQVPHEINEIVYALTH